MEATSAGLQGGNLAAQKFGSRATGERGSSLRLLVALHALAIELEHARTATSGRCASHVASLPH